MAEFYGPFDYDGTAADPSQYEYTAVEERMFNMGLFSNGILPTTRIITDDILHPNVYLGTSLQVTSGTGLSVIISPGFAVVEGARYGSTEAKVLTFEQANIAKIYDIVVEFSLIDQIITTKSQLRTGPSLAAALIRDSSKYQICIATVSIPANAAAIRVADITDHRLNTHIAADGKPICGLVSAVMQADTKEVNDRLQAQFAGNEQVFLEWFNNLIYTLDGDVAGHLQNEIDITSKVHKPTGASNLILTLAGLVGYSTYPANMRLTIIAPADSDGAKTININDWGAVPIYRQGTTSAPIFKVGKAYELWLDGARFFLRASAEGTATSSEVLAGKTYSNDIDTALVGTMPNRKAITITPTERDIVIPAGYHSGSGKVKGVTINPEDIAEGKTVYGVNGTAPIMPTKVTAGTGVYLVSGKSHKVNNAPSMSMAVLRMGRKVSGTLTVSYRVAFGARDNPKDITAKVSGCPERTVTNGVKYTETVAVSPGGGVYIELWGMPSTDSVMELYDVSASVASLADYVSIS